MTAQLEAVRAPAHAAPPRAKIAAAYANSILAHREAIVELDRRRIGRGEPGPITRRLMTCFEAVVSGRDDTYARWLTPATQTAGARSGAPPCSADPGVSD